MSKTPKSTEVPVTQKMLYDVRDQLIAHTNSKFHEVKREIHRAKSEFHGVKSEIQSMRGEIQGEIHGMKSEIHGMKSEIHGMKSDLHEVKAEVKGLTAEVHKLAVLVEEQNARNIIVLDGLSGLFHRQDRIEHEWKDFEKTYNT